MVALSAAGRGKGAVTIKVMLVDDHVVVREGLKSLLANEKDISVVGEAASGEEALEVAARVQPEVVVMDLRLKGMQGVEATSALVQSFPGIKVVVLSMYDEEEMVMRALKAGAIGFTLKRASVEELVRAIRAAAQGEAYLDPAITKRVVERLQKAGSKGQSSSGVDSPEQLTPREVEVLQLVAQGLTNAEIARRLYISVKTVQAHRASLMRKLGAHDRVDLVKYAIKAGLLDGDGPLT